MYHLLSYFEGTFHLHKYIFIQEEFALYHDSLSFPLSSPPHFIWMF